MSEPVKIFGESAQRLSRSPLSIIALFIVLVYALAALVVIFSGSLSGNEKMPLIYFLILFPILVLIVFAWLVSRHSNKLFAPSDFRNEENYVRTLTATASLAVASIGDDRKNVSSTTIRQVVDAVLEASTPSRTTVEDGYWRSRILWVDDRPENNISERRAMEAMGLTFVMVGLRI